ncbi:putative protein with four repeated domains in the fasciclin I family of proteins [Lyophyllum shimeji]|uniref:FAS1 domain-containing protein n=1 Tax=Lyophyllum shimeji TaxID=47721 RepID=A0A9P3PFW5_LYOSH|nr:putative protein with four repeated domains in the fasciclin I family of proteins [Lyophyllum shimeji]
MRFPIKTLIFSTLAVVATSKNTDHLSDALTWFASGQESLDGGHPKFPPHQPLPWPGPGNETIYNTLKNDTQYTKLVKAINFVDGIASILNDSSKEMTFFAVPNSALHPPKHRKRCDVSDSLQGYYDLSDAIDLIDGLDGLDSDGHKKDKEKCRKILKKVVHAILSYHILPEKIEVAILADNNTRATHLKLDNALDGEPLRMRLTKGFLSPLPVINMYSKVNRPNGTATNGFIHGINNPLLPPPSVFQEMFMAPSAFSTFTSAIQRTGLTDSVDLRYKRKKDDDGPSFKGTSAVTVFAPSNRAFAELPKRLQLFLFSPFGEHILKKLLQFHIVPDCVFHTDYQHNATDSSEARFHFDIEHHGALLTTNTEAYEVRPKQPQYEPIESFDMKLPTALTNHTLEAHVEKYNVTIPFPGPRKPHKIATNFRVNGHARP